MGISGLLPFLENSSTTCNLSDFYGKTAAVDSYCFLHKGAVPVAENLIMGEDRQVYVAYCMKYVNMLKRNNIKPIMVFDGNHLPAKSLTENKRKELKLIARQKAQASFRMGKPEEARSYLKQCIDITPQMAFALIKECRRNDVDCIVAPYESDSQLAYLNLKGIADVVITEDSDLIMFGCTKVLYKLDLNGVGKLVEKEKIHLSMKLNPANYTFDKFQIMCVLSGCDYIDSLPGVGLKKALKFISLTAEDDPLKFLDKVPRYLNLKKAVVTPEYKENFMIALATIKHQIVFDPSLRKLVRLTEPGTHGTRLDYCRNAGKFFDDKTAFQIALGNLNPFTLEAFDDWNPDKRSDDVPSIWSKKYVKDLTLKKGDRVSSTVKSPKKEQKLVKGENLKRKRSSPSTCSIKRFFKAASPKKPSEYDDDEKNLINIYSNLPEKTEITDNSGLGTILNEASTDDNKIIVSSRYFANQNGAKDDISPVLSDKTKELQSNKFRSLRLRPSLERLKKTAPEKNQKENQ